MVNKRMVISTGKLGTPIGFDAHQDGDVKKSARNRCSTKVATREGDIVLIIIRRAGDKLVIGEAVTVTVLNVKGNQVRIGIDAPRDIPVNREEIYQHILKDKKALNGYERVRTPVPTAQIPIRRLTLSD